MHLSTSKVFKCWHWQRSTETFAARLELSNFNIKQQTPLLIRRFWTRAMRADCLFLFLIVLLIATCGVQSRNLTVHIIAHTHDVLPCKWPPSSAYLRFRMLVGSKLSISTTTAWTRASKQLEFNMCLIALFQLLKVWRKIPSWIS